MMGRRGEPAQAAGLPAGREALAAAAGRLLAEVGEYAAAAPEAAAAGGWWRPTPLRQPPKHTVLDPETARRAAVLVLFTPGDQGPALLLTERGASMTHHAGQVSFPGGAEEGFDAGPTGAALREAQEEVGLDPARVEVFGVLPPAPVPVSGFMVTPVVGIAGDPGVLVPQSGEVARVLRVPVGDLADPAHRYTAPMRRGGRTLNSPAFRAEGWGGAVVWGFTGILLDRMLTRLGWAQPWDPARELDPSEFL